jgi:hypothetical protein
VEIIREEVPGPTLTTVSSTLIEGGIQFLFPTGTPTIPDTPEAFGNASGVDFGSATEVKFNPDGMLVNQLGAVINGTVFVMFPSERLSSRAVTVLGSTGRVRGYKWDGRVWKLV